MSRLWKGSSSSQNWWTILKVMRVLNLSYYKDDIDHKLVNECYQFKEYLHHRKSQNTEENMPSKMQCVEVLQLICEQHLIEVFLNITTVLKLYLTMPITSCEAERNFSKLSFIKNKFWSTMTEEYFNSLCILSLEIDIVRKLSYDKTVGEYVARKNRKKEYFVKCASCSMYSDRCLK